MSTYICRHHGAEHTTHGDIAHRVCGHDGTLHYACAPRPAPAGTPRPADWPAYLAWTPERPLAARREDAYTAHFDDCPHCPGSPTGECPRAEELRRSWQAAEADAAGPTITDRGCSAVDRSHWGD